MQQVDWHADLRSCLHGIESNLRSVESWRRRPLPEAAVKVQKAGRASGGPVWRAADVSDLFTAVKDTAKIAEQQQQQQQWFQQMCQKEVASLRIQLEDALCNQQHRQLKDCQAEGLQAAEQAVGSRCSEFAELQERVQGLVTACTSAAEQAAEQAVSWSNGSSNSPIALHLQVAASSVDLEQMRADVEAISEQLCELRSQKQKQPEGLDDASEPPMESLLAEVDSANIAELHIAQEEVLAGLRARIDALQAHPAPQAQASVEQTHPSLVQHNLRDLVGDLGKCKAQLAALEGALPALQEGVRAAKITQEAHQRLFELRVEVQNSLSDVNIEMASTRRKAEAAEAQSLQDADLIEQMQTALNQLNNPKIKVWPDAHKDPSADSSPVMNAPQSAASVRAQAAAD
ncbi:hypothetical protein WJX84_010059 [Apatococcus fuscideae]|uniref:Uncharacterized protein n=1 Tax=Apatococcus fuscideae TaxID=2026836 RepID=A0AAW1STH8_9CHLO